MIDLYDGGFADLLGPNYRADPEVQALSYALKQGMQLLIDKAGKSMVYCSIDTLDESALDLLAAELRTQYYDTSYDIDKKRELVKSTLIWHQQAGTAAAVKELVRKIYGDSAQIHEWWEYGGEPYTFMVSASNTLSQDDIAHFNEILKNAKNVRSALEMTGLDRGIDYGYYALQGIGRVKHHSLVYSTDILIS